MADDQMYSVSNDVAGNMAPSCAKTLEQDIAEKFAARPVSKDPNGKSQDSKFFTPDGTEAYDRLTQVNPRSVRNEYETPNHLTVTTDNFAGGSFVDIDLKPANANGKGGIKIIEILNPGKPPEFTEDTDRPKPLPLSATQFFRLAEQSHFFDADKDGLHKCAAEYFEWQAKQQQEPPAPKLPTSGIVHVDITSDKQNVHVQIGTLEGANEVVTGATYHNGRPQAESSMNYAGQPIATLPAIANEVPSLKAIPKEVLQGIINAGPEATYTVIHVQHIDPAANSSLPVASGAKTPARG